MRTCARRSRTLERRRPPPPQAARECIRRPGAKSALASCRECFRDFIPRELVGVDGVGTLMLPVAVLVEPAELLPPQDGHDSAECVQVSHLDVRAIEIVRRRT